MISNLRDFFDLNHEIVLFVYGQVFFVLGLAVALQSRRHSRLDLARSLQWLALFGLTHGFHEWGLLLVPVQATYLSPEAVDFLIIIRTLLLGVSFVVLFQFGAELTKDRWPIAAFLPGVLFAAWLLFVAGHGFFWSANVGEWERMASITARYFMAFPGGLLAAYGLRHQAERQIRPLGLSQIYNVLRVAGLALAAYAFFGGLIVPSANFFPANVLNQSTVVVTLGIPVEVLRSTAGLILAISIIRALEVFDVEVDRIIESMEVEQSLAAERERIGRELHDGAIQRVYTAGLIVESARGKVDEESLVAQRLDRAMTALREAIESLRTYMTELRPETELITLADGLQEQANDPRLSTLMDVRLELELSSDDSLNPARTTHVLAIVGEALANAARHAQARQVQVSAAHINGNLRIVIEDDGKGFHFTGVEDGYGLRNMRDRARLLGGRLTVSSEPGKGTRIVLSAPWEEV
ncbi:MAG: sensor histidine kinase [Chloroflexota bacterium]